MEEPTLLTLKKNKHSLSLGYGSRGGGVMVCILAFYFDDPSSNLADNKNFLY